MKALPGEFLLVAECCRWPVPQPDPLAARLHEVAVDWPRVARIAKRHRVEALVWNRLRSSNLPVPEDAGNQLQAAAERTARENLQAVRECLQLKAAFEAGGVPILFIKGVTLAMLAYGTLALKAGWDIDVLVDGDRIDAAATILAGAGYRCILPVAPDAEQLRRWHALSKESVWRHSDNHAVVELHSRLVDNPMLVPGIGLHAPQPVGFAGGLALPTLPFDELFAYLCVHGTSTAWFRLKWLADLSALIAPLPPADLDRLYRGALELGAGRAASVALILCERLLSATLPDSLRRELERDLVARAMARVALHMMTGRYAESELHSYRFGTLPIQLMRPFLLPGWRFALSEARRQMAAPEDRFELERTGPASPLRLFLRKLARPFKREGA